MFSSSVYQNQPGTTRNTIQKHFLCFLGHPYLIGWEPSAKDVLHPDTSLQFSLVFRFHVLMLHYWWFLHIFLLEKQVFLHIFVVCLSSSFLFLHDPCWLLQALWFLLQSQYLNESFLPFYLLPGWVWMVLSSYVFVLLLPFPALHLLLLLVSL